MVRIGGGGQVMVEPKQKKQTELEQHETIKSVVKDNAQVYIDRIHERLPFIEKEDMKKLATKWLTETEQLNKGLNPNNPPAYNIQSARMFFYLNAIGTLIVPGGEATTKDAKEIYNQGVAFKGAKTAQECFDAVNKQLQGMYDNLPPMAAEEPTEKEVKRTAPEVPAVPQAEQKPVEQRVAEGTADLRKDLQKAQSTDELKRIEDALRKRWQDAMSDFQKVSSGWFTSEAAKVVGAQMLKDMEGEYKAFLAVRKQAAKVPTLEAEKTALRSKIDEFDAKYNNMQLTTDLNQRIQTLLKTESGRSVLQKVLPSESNLRENVLYIDPKTREADPQKQMQAYTTIKEMSAEGKQEIIDLLLSTEPTKQKLKPPRPLKPGPSQREAPSRVELPSPSAEVTLPTQVTAEHTNHIRTALKGTDFFSVPAPSTPAEWLAPLKKYGREEKRGGVNPVLVIDANSLLKAPEFEKLKDDVSSLKMEKELKGATFEFQTLLKSVTIKLVKKR